MSGPIIVLLSLGLILYYYLIFRHTLETQVLHQHTVIDNKSI
jgi:hypothetical protein